MKTSVKKLCSLTMALILIFSLTVTSFGANAAEDFGKVRVIVKNETFATADSAAWAGELINSTVTLESTSTMMSVIEEAFKANHVTYSLNNYNYLATINGLSEYACNGSGGWMMTLNDWFTNESSDAYTVEKGSLTDGDVITVLYTCSWGGDVGSLWGDTSTTLKSLDVKGAALNKPFDSSITEYTLTVNPENGNSIFVVPEAFNKNYQVRTYLNNYTPDQNGTEIKVLDKPVSVQSGDTVYIGVGNENWATMNTKADETVYRLHISYTPQTGDVNLDGKVNINDVTLLQKYIAAACELSADQKTAANVFENESITIDNATAIQKIIARVA